MARLVVSGRLDLLALVPVRVDIVTLILFPFLVPGTLEGSGRLFLLPDYTVGRLEVPLAKL